jgi:cobalt/nickel transport system permease protein
VTATLQHTGLAGDLSSPIHRLDPRAKTVGLLAVTFVAVTTPVALWPVFGACAAALAVVALLARVPARVLWTRGRIVLLPVALVALLAPLTGSWEVAAGVGAKATIGVVAAVLLGATTAFPALLRGLESLRMPRLMVLIAGLMYRYLFVVVEEVGRMRAALASRAYRPRTAVQAAPIGRAAGTLFLRSYLRGERVHLAMLARGYDGRMPELHPLRLTAVDLAFVALVLAALVPLRLVLA